MIEHDIDTTERTDTDTSHPVRRRPEPGDTGASGVDDPSTVLGGSHAELGGRT